MVLSYAMLIYFSQDWRSAYTHLLHRGTKKTSKGNTTITVSKRVQHLNTSPKLNGQDIHRQNKGPNTGPIRLTSNILNKAVRNSKMVVPKVVHYTWFYSKKNCNLKFHHFMSLLSAYKYMKPKEIIVWYDDLPCGKWWEEAKSRVPVLTLHYMAPPQTVFGKPIRVPEHKSDVARLDILLKYGGIYFDTDMVALKSWDPLLYYNTTLGAESNSHLANGVIISAKNASFLRIWKDTYHNFRDNLWGYNSVSMPFRLARQHPALVHIEWNTLIHPHWQNTLWIFQKEKLWDWSSVYGMHLYYRVYKPQHNPESIKTLNSTLGEVFRLIYYNSTSIIH